MSNSDNQPNAPLTAFEKARLKWFENYGSSIVERNRYYVLVALMAGAIIAMSGVVWVMMPLKTVVPYVIKVNEANGHVTAEPLAAQQYTPDKREKQYFLGQWVIKMQTIDRFMSERYLSEAYSFTRDKATNEFNDWFNEEKPLAQIVQDPSLTRQVKVRSISFVNDNAALVRFTTERRTMGARDPAVTNLLITIHFEVVTPKTEKEIFDNPIGIFITHFSINEDMT